VIVAWPVVARIAALMLAGVILQLAFLSQVTILGTTPDAVPLLVISLGLLGGALIGAVSGFAMGLLLDSLLLGTLGGSSLVLLMAGYLAGRYRESFEVSGRLGLAAIGGVLTLTTIMTFAVVQFTLGVDAPVSLLVLRDALMKSLLNVLLVIPVHAGVRRALRPALIEDPAPRPTALAGLREPA
jgi:rod shape-determining protein MreD